MKPDQIGAWVTFGVQIAANMAVFAAAFPAWRRMRQPFLALLAVSALLGVLALVAGITFNGRPISPEKIVPLRLALQVVTIGDLACYACGVVGLVRYLNEFRGASAGDGRRTGGAGE